VKRMVLLFTVAAVVAAMLALAGPALASHPHYLVTPGTCVEDVASGQTSKAQGERGGHKFHENVHLGQPGSSAFTNESNPVSVGKGSCPAG
jgi:hypothetical protein